MPKLPSWNFQSISCGAAGESVSTKSPIRNRKATVNLMKDTKAKFDAFFPVGFTAEEYALVLFRKCVSLPPEERGKEVDSTIGKLISLERLSFAYFHSDRAEFFKLAKRTYASKILSSALSKRHDADYWAQSLENWTKWIYLKGFNDVGDFFFWNAWRERFTELPAPKYEDITLRF